MRIPSILARTLLVTRVSAANLRALVQSLGLCLGLAAAAWPQFAWARTKLVALPDREKAVIRLDNPAFTLVEEERVLALQRGGNPVDFSWNGVHLDPDSIRLTLLDHKDAVRVISVRYPPSEQALIWELWSDEGASVRVRIAYLLAGIDRLVEYRAIADGDEKRLDLDSYLILRNFSGEDFARAALILGQGETFQKEVRHEETRKMLFEEKPGLAVAKVLMWDASKLPWDPKRQQTNVGIPFQYRIANTKAAGLGEHLYWNGKARVFQRDGHGSTIFGGEDHLALTPVGESMRLNMGQSRDLEVLQTKQREEKINIRRNSGGSIVLYDTDELMRVAIRNFKDQPVTLEVFEFIEGQWDMEESTHGFERKDFRTLVFTLQLEPKATQTIEYHYHRRNVRP